MSSKNPMNRMLAEAVDTLARAERLHQQFFSLRPSAGSAFEESSHAIAAAR